MIDKKKRIAVDLDGTLTMKGKFPEIWSITSEEMHNLYEKVEPDTVMIDCINRLYDQGYVIYIFTSRSDLFQKQTKQWLKKNGVKHDYFICNKPFYDYIIDDKAVSIEDIKNGKGI